MPQVAQVFAGTKRSLPFLTTVMLGLSAAVRNYGWWMLGAVLLAAIGARLALAQEAFRLKFDAAWLKLPLVGKLARGYNAARFASTLAMLATAGVPIDRRLVGGGRLARDLGGRAGGGRCVGRSAVLHAVLEALDGTAEVGTHVPKLLGTEDRSRPGATPSSTARSRTRRRRAGSCGCRAATARAR